MNIWVCEVRYGRAHISAYDVVKETPRTFQIGAVKHLVGAVYHNKVITKASSVFRTYIEAIEYCIRKLNEEKSSYLEKAEKCEKQMIELERLLDETS